jgi:hypothetical protein
MHLLSQIVCVVLQGMVLHLQSVEGGVWFYIYIEGRVRVVLHMAAL